MTGFRGARIVLADEGASELDQAVRDQVLVNEVRTELKGSIVGWLGLLVVTSFLGFHFAGRADRLGFALWLGAMSLLLGGWIAAWVGFRLMPPNDETVLRAWIPGAKLAMTLGNIATAGSVWVFLPVSGPDLRALLLIFYAWFLIIQFAAATEATQVLRSAVLLVIGSLTAWLLVSRPPYFLAFSAFLPLFGVTLIAIRRFVREPVVKAAAAQAIADASRQDLAKALVDLERERDAKTHFIQAASHDLQQPLQAAALFLDGVRPGRPQAEQASALDKAGRSLRAARDLVDAMLQHLRLEGGVVKPRWASFMAQEIFDRIELTQSTVAAAGRVTLSFVGGRTALHADPELLGRAVENLVANAIRHSGGRRILVGVRRAAGNVTLWVIDDGKGLADQDETQLFRPFEQGASVGAAGGFGLGLSAARALAEILGGTCGTRRMLSRGAAFYIQLPMVATVGEAKCAA